MTMLMGDSRECAKAVNAIMLQGPRPGQKADRQAEWFEKAYVFGHYDSRGGATLVLAKNHVEALQKYGAAFCVDDDAEYRDNAIDGLQDDFIKRVELIVCDEPLPAEEAELDEEYEGAYRYGKVQSRYEKVEYDYEGPQDADGRFKRIPTGKFSKWVDEPILVMWKGRIPPKLQLPKSLLEHEYRIVRERLGEDACGLVLCR